MAKIATLVLVVLAAACTSGCLGPEAYYGIYGAAPRCIGTEACRQEAFLEQSYAASARVGAQNNAFQRCSAAMGYARGSNQYCQGVSNRF
ncbi:hypothetical protein KW797_00320 [Candidatus Parcubacteria bacterium]|nr:hypothetical protein [Candidatus Parcubacteria bacterium]